MHVYRGLETCGMTASYQKYSEDSPFPLSHADHLLNETLFVLDLILRSRNVGDFSVIGGMLHFSLGLPWRPRYDSQERRNAICRHVRWATIWGFSRSIPNIPKQGYTPVDITLIHFHFWWFECHCFLYGRSVQFWIETKPTRSWPPTPLLNQPS